MDFLKQFENKFIPFNVTVDVETSAPYDEPNIYFDVIDSPIPLKTKDPKKYTFDDVSVDAIFDVVTLDDKKVADVSLRLNYNGEIVYQRITHYDSNNLSFLRSQHTERDTSIPYESFTFEKSNETEYKIFQIIQVNGNVVGATSFNSSQNMNPNKPFSTLLRSSLFAKPDFMGDILETPYRYQGMYSTLKKNNLLIRFGGKYIGSIFKEIQSTTENDTIKLLQPLVVVTEQKKDNNNYRCYTLFENPDIATIRAAIREAKKTQKKYITPKYVTKMGENGEEELVLYNGQPVSENCQEGHDEYNKFVEEFIAPFSSVQPVNIEQFMLKPRDLSNSQR